MLFEPGIVEAPTVHGSQLEVVDDYVRPANEAAQQFPSVFALEVEGKTALVAVDRQVVGGQRTNERRAPGPGVVTMAGLFDLDDVGSHITKGHRAQRPGQYTGQIENP